VQNTKARGWRIRCANRVALGGGWVWQGSLVATDKAVVVGRRSELAVLRSFIERIGEGAAAFVVSGPGGIGKTTVWRTGVALARTAGCRVLVARPSSAEARLSFAGLADLLAPLEPGLFDRLPEPQRRALGVALLKEDPGQRRADSRAVATATASLLRQLAEDGPLVLAVDDAQWLDAATDDALRFALRRLPDVPLGVLSSIRADAGQRDTFDAAVARERRVEVALAPLSLAAVHDILRAELGQSLPRPTLVKVVQLSGGNPFYAIEIARELSRLGATTASGLLPIPPDVQALVGARVARLPKRTQDALLLASSAAAPTTAFIDEEALASAEDADLVRITRDGLIRFTHPLVAAAVYDTGGAARLRAAHRALADRVEDREERARHLALATTGRDDAVAAVLDEAAVHAASRGASAAAAELARLALDHTGREGEPKLTRSRALAHYLLGAGDTAGAREVLEACDPESVDGGARAELLLQLGELLWFEQDSWERGYALVLEALEYARDPELAARAHRAAAWLSQDVDAARAIAHAEAAVALLDPDRNPGAYSSVLLHSAYLRLIDGRGADDDAYRRGRALQEQTTDWSDISAVVGMWALFKDDFADAKQFFEAGLERSRAEGDEPSVQGTLVRLTEIACWTGDWEAADRFAAEGVELAARVGSTAYLGSALYARGLVDAHMGRVEDARAGGERIIELFASGTHAALGHWVLGFLALSLEQPALADEHLTRAAALVAELGHREPARFRFHPDQVEAAVELGDLDRARRLLDALEERADTFPRPWIAGAVARCSALLLAAQGDPKAGLRGIEASPQRASSAMPFEQARTLLVEGRILRRLKQKLRARIALEQALAIFRGLGAELWVQRTQNELARVSVRGASGALSATELRIARLAADGLTNQAIAAEVFVTQKTVEANLARAYRKLDIRSRAQLGRALDEGPTATIS
jgi:DNA-binding CsgD family transcriptional regulator